jgi:hypothetical protein
VLQQTLAGFEVRCCALQRLHEARRGVHSRVQAAAADRVAGGRDIFHLAENGDGASVPWHVIADLNYSRYARVPTIFDLAIKGDVAMVLCHLIGDADAVNKRDEG